LYLIFAINAITGFAQAEYDHVQHFIFPRMGRIRTAQEIIFGTNAKAC
jgi:hypothetical protein